MPSPANDRRISSLWIMDADGSRPRQLLDEASSAEWSPDGTRIAFVAPGEPSGSQIFVRYMDAEGATTQISNLTSSPGSITWSPDGEWIAFTMSAPRGGRLEHAATAGCGMDSGATRRSAAR